MKENYKSSPRWNLATYGKTQWIQGDSSVRECINEQTSEMIGEVEENQADFLSIKLRRGISERYPEVGVLKNIYF